jgi:hypothetical protein
MPPTYLKPVKMCYLHQAAADLIAGLPAMSHETRFALAVLCADVYVLLDVEDLDPDQLRTHSVAQQILAAALRYPDVSERFWRENAQARQKAAQTRARGLSKNPKNPNNLPTEDA